MEYDHMAELGLCEEKQFITGCSGILTRNNYARDLCARVIRNGDRFYDIISRYEMMCTYDLNREPGPNSATSKMIVPFLKACGITDFEAYKFAKENMDLIPGAKETMVYLNGLLPSFITTGSFEHHIMSVCDSIDFPLDSATCTKVEFDSVGASKEDCRKLRDYANTISSLRLPKTMYTVTKAHFLDEDDAEIITNLDKIFVDELPQNELFKSFKDVQSIGPNEKAYSLLEIRKKTDIEFSETVYVGSNTSDNQALDLIRDSSGLAISFNGNEYAVRGSNIVVMSNNAIVIAVLASEFYNEGIQAVYDMVEHWNRKSLSERKCSDRHLMDTMLDTFPKKLPVVKIATRNNMDELVEKSEEYRRKVVQCKTY